MRHRGTDVVYICMYEVYQSQSSPSARTPFCIWEIGRLEQIFAYNHFVLHTEKLIGTLQQDVCSNIEFPARTEEVRCMLMNTPHVH